MKCLIVVAHPLQDSLCHALAETVASALRAKRHDVETQDLYLNAFAPCLTPAERRGYYDPPFDAADVQDQADKLLGAECLVLVFPTWWFGFPAILKGWFDRVWAPGVAYDHAADFGPITPRLHNLKQTLAITTLGAPWWVDRILLRQPVKRILKTALIGVCAPNCRFEMLSLYKAEGLTEARVARFKSRIELALAQLR